MLSTSDESVHLAEDAHDYSNASILQGDCREVLKSLPSNSIHCCVTSPPYFGLRDYGCADQIGLEDTPEGYVEQMVGVFREVRRVLHPRGLLFLNLGDSFAATRSYQVAPTKWNELDFGKSNASRVPDGLKPKDLMMIPARVALALQADGWWLRQDIIWAKKAPMPESVTDRFTRSHEYVFMLAKSERYFFDQEAVKEPVAESSMARISQVTFDSQTGGEKDYQHGTNLNRSMRKTLENFAKNPSGRNKRDVWLLGPEPTPFAHFATMPQALVEPCILAGSSEKGCCPECSAPWKRIVEKTPMLIDRSERSGQMGKFGRTQTSGAMVQAPSRRTLGWEPTCEHDIEPVPCTVLDPFAGSGTVLRVAIKNGRRAIGIELNPEYVEIIGTRIRTEVRLPLDFEETTS